MAKKALITGIYGQDGSYLTELLLEHGYEVWGVDRDAPEDFHETFEHLKPKVHLLQGDLMDQMGVLKMFEKVMPDEIYNFAACSFIPFSWDEPVITGEVNALGVPGNHGVHCGNPEGWAYLQHGHGLYVGNGGLHIHGDSGVGGGEGFRPAVGELR